ncbi:MAG TPA: alpha/beta hydrolase [Acetobacteraceae bacterium]|jgi:pimeloyl-ACP methyl ester carboxylesterase|nr:alpha/beta hydrolase [Acetobacteraceae bacterium]
MPFPITEHCVRTRRHTTFYLACGPEDAPAIVFVHGWPELSISWRHQLPCFAALGFRCIAPDMRGYGRSTVHPRHEDYALEHATRDMIELLDALGREKAVWVGHDWGGPVVWSMASHHPDRCFGVANLCVPYIARGFAPANFLPLIDRALYPATEYPAGQWEYMLFYEEDFAKASATFEANVENTVKVLFRKGNPTYRGKPARTALVRHDGGWFNGAAVAPDVPLDTDVLTVQDLRAYVAALQCNGFFGPDSWYMNHTRNIEYAAEAANSGRLSMPVLFLHAAHDYTCETLVSRLAEPMRLDCDDLTEAVVPSGHWMAQEKPSGVNAAIAQWLAHKLPSLWCSALEGKNRA